MISYTLCEKCYLSESVHEKDASGNHLPIKSGTCKICGDLKQSFSGSDCIEKFADYLYWDLGHRTSHRSINAKIKVFAHNFRGYDGHFIFKDLFSRKIQDPSFIILNGSKITCLDIANIRFQDSLALFKCALAKLPVTFKFEDRLVKGHFPFQFNVPGNENYCGDVPDLEFFVNSRTKPSEKDKIQNWRSQRMQEGNWNFKHELEKYCEADVEILTISVMSFIDKFRNITGINPITRNFSLPSIAMEIFTTLHLKPNIIGITPISSYMGAKQDSVEGNIWLDWIEESDSVKLIREYRISCFWADGFDPESNTIYEYHGCYFHGCRRGCSVRDPGDHERVLEKRRVYIAVRDNLIPSLKYVEMWGCEFRDMIRVDENLRSFNDSRKKYYSILKNDGGIKLRDCYFGGRTNNLVFFREASDEEEIKYLDVTSLYPFVLHKYDFPVGHPVIIKKNVSLESRNYFGVVRCRVLPPPNLYLPILPVRIKGKLVFPSVRNV